MQELVKIQSQEINNELVNSVNAKDLYAFVCKDTTHYSKWIKTNLINNEFFTEGKDYIILASEKNPLGGRPTQEIIVTLDTAKELAMMTRSQKGKEIREYFIQCEKELRNQNQMKLPQTYKEALLELVKAEEEKEKLLIENKQNQKTIKEQEGIIKDYDLIHQTRRQKKELRSAFSKNVKSIAYLTKKEVREVYNFIYQHFRKLHSFPYDKKINIDFIAENNDYLSEVLEISLSILNKCRQIKESNYY